MTDSNSENKNVRNDEIDLLDLLNRIGRTISKWFSGLLYGILISIVFLLRNWLPLLISIIAAIGLSYLMQSTSASFYTSDLILRNNLIPIDQKMLSENESTTAEMIAKINKLHMFCMENNKEALSAAMSIKPEDVKSISDISAYWIIDLNRDGIPDYVDYKGNHDVYDTINVRIKSSFDIRVKINSSMDLGFLRNGLMNFIEKDSLLQQRNSLRQKQNQEMLTRLNYDIKQLDSLQKVKYFEETRNMKPSTGGQIIFMQEHNTQLVYADIYLLYKKKQVLETENNLYKGIITVTNDFSLPTIRENGFMFYATYIIPLFLIGTLIVLIMLANHKKIAETFKKY